jgi:peptidoglycan/LPS O-acetylase OafA/YrhL
MARIPAWAFALLAVVFVGLAIWSATDENWSGLIVAVVLAVLCVAGSMRGRSTT